MRFESTRGVDFCGYLVVDWVSLSTMIRCACVGLARVAVGSALADDDEGMTF